MKKIVLLILFTNFSFMFFGKSLYKPLEQAKRDFKNSGAKVTKEWTEVFSDNKDVLENNPDEVTFAVIPDTQGYVRYFTQNENRKKYPIDQYLVGNREMEFIANNSVSNGGSLSFALHVGDVVNERNWSKYEWKRADQAISILDGKIPYLMVPGNHDYDKRVKSKKGDYNILKGSKYYQKHFGKDSKHYKNAEWLGGFSPSGLSSWAVFKNPIQDILAIGLELEAGDSTLNWAQKVIDEHPDLPVIVFTHSYIGMGVDQNGNAKYTGRGNFEEEDGNSSEEVSKKFILKNKNIFLVLCGHVFSGDDGESMRVDTNEAGYKVYTLLANYQARNDLMKLLYPDAKKAPGWAGDGFIRLMSLNLKQKQIKVKTYSTEFNCFETDADSDFILPIDWDWDERFSK